MSAGAAVMRPRAVQQRDEVGADQPVGRIGEAEAQLLRQVVAQRARAFCQIIDTPPLGVEGMAAAPPDAGVDRSVQGGAIGDPTGIVGIGEIGIERRLRGARDRLRGDEGEAVATSDRRHRLIGRRSLRGGKSGRSSRSSNGLRSSSSWTKLESSRFE